MNREETAKVINKAISESLRPEGLRPVEEQVMSAAIIAEVLFKKTRLIRDQILSIPKLLAPALAMKPSKEIEKVLRVELRKILSELSK